MKSSTFLTLLLASALPTLAFADHATDSRIEKAAKNSYNFHVVLQDKVKADAANGIVTLTGTVEDKDRRRSPRTPLAELPGVVHVDNEITVEGGQPEHSDGWIAFKIRSTLLVRANVSATKTHVDVHERRRSRCTGTAETSAQKQLTEEYAKEIEGVKSVKNDIVIVGPNGATPTMSDKMDDASITAQVKFALLGNSATSALKTKVTTEGGVVHALRRGGQRRRPATSPPGSRYACAASCRSTTG